MSSIRKVIEQESVHRKGNNAKLEGIKDGEQIHPTPFLIRMRMVFILCLILLGGILFCVGEVEAVTITVNPGESIQEAINNLSAEGGIIELAAGTHEVNDTLYPPGTFELWGGGTAQYSIIINKSNVTITGTHDSIVRHHNKSLPCFYIPDLELIEGPDVFVENVTFKGFTTASTYTAADYPRNMIISARHVKNFTVEDIHDTSWASNYVGVWSSQSHQRYSENVSYKNNILEHCGVLVGFTDNVYIINNSILGGGASFALYTARNLKHVHIIRNRVINAGAVATIVLDGGQYWEVRDNFVQGSRQGIRFEQSPRDVICENNTITGASRQGGITVYARYPCENVTVRNNRIYNNAHGIYTTEYYDAAGIYSMNITNNVIYGSTYDGIKMTTERSRLIMTNNIITNNGGYGINNTASNISWSLSFNDIWNNTQGRYNGTTEGEGEIEVDPNFADAENGDFYLKSTDGRWNGSTWVHDDVTSPCIDTGDPVSDYSNEPEPNGGRINMGAYGNTGEASKSPPPPASITNLQNTTGQKWICWTWINPTDDDFNHTIVYLDGNWKTNTSKSYYIAKGLDTNTSHEISTHTVDTNGNVNKTWVNQTAKTNLSADTTPPIIINVNITDITLSSASITWDTDDISDSLVRYGTSSENYMEYVIDEMPVRNHSILLTGLEQNTTYYYVVNSTNPDNLSDQSGEYDFTTVSGCFIATAAYGTSLHKNIDILRNFRDKILVQTPPGRTLVTTYYSTSPPIANALAKNDSLRSAVRLLLITPLVYFAEMILNGVCLIAIVFLGLGAFFVGMRMRSLKVVLKAFRLGLLTAAVLTGMVFALGWLAYTYPGCAVIATYILPLIIPTSMGVGVMVLVLLKSQGIVKKHEIA